MLDLLTADYTFVNERLARHLRHPEHRRREVPARDACPDERRGLLGQGSMLMLTSVADRTSPVQRGKWIMEVLLGSPPPPPPPNVPPLEDTKAATAGGKPLSTRERMEEHRKNPACAVVPPGDRSARPGARELRRRSARGASRTTASPSTPTACSTTARKMSGPGRPARRRC